jgi:hypothetical protein
MYTKILKLTGAHRIPISSIVEPQISHVQAPPITRDLVIVCAREFQGASVDDFLLRRLQYDSTATHQSPLFFFPRSICEMSAFAQTFFRAGRAALHRSSCLNPLQHAPNSSNTAPLTKRPKSGNAASPSQQRTSNTRPMRDTMPTSIVPDTQTISRT